MLTSARKRDEMRWAGDSSKSNSKDREKENKTLFILDMNFAATTQKWQT